MTEMLNSPIFWGTIAVILAAILIMRMRRLKRKQ